MKTKSAFVFLAVTLLGLTTPVARAVLVVAPSFPINGVPASQFPPGTVNASLLAAFEKDIAV